MHKKTIKCTLFMMLVMGFMMPQDVSAWPWDEEVSQVKSESYDKLVTKNLELRKKIESLKEEYEKAKGMREVLVEKVKTLQKAREALITDVAALKVELTEEKKAYESLSKLLDERDSDTKNRLKAKIESGFKNKIATLQKKLKEASASRKQSGMQLKSEKKKLEGELSARRKELDKQYTICKTQDAKIKALEKECEGQFKSTSKKYEKKLQSAKKENEDKLASVKREQ